MTEEVQSNGAAAPDQGPNAQFAIQRVYTKDMSFETPNSPAIFKKEWQPEVKLDLDTRSEEIEANLYEVVLSLTVTVKTGGENAFLCEVQQAGVFSVADMQDAQKAHTLGSFCPNILFPYAREAVSSLVSRGSFPQLNLAPVNFDALFASYVQKRQAELQAEEAPQA